MNRHVGCEKSRLGWFALGWFAVVTFLAVGPANGVTSNSKQTNSKERAELIESTADSTALKPAVALSDEKERADALERDALRAFLKNDCAKVLSLRSPRNYEQSSPRLLALIASCEPEGKDPDKMLSFARSKAPKDDTLLLLQARYRSKKQMINAKELWIELQNRTTDSRLKEIASDYIEGSSASVDEIFSYKGSSFYGYVQAGAIADTNPSYAPLGTTANASTGLSTSGAVAYRKPLTFGRYGADYSFSGSDYFGNHAGDMITQDLAAPFEFDATQTSGVILKPYANYVYLSGASYLYDLGLSTALSFEHEDVTQILSFSVYYETHFSNEDQPQDGTHVKCDYTLKSNLFTAVDATVSLYVDHASSGFDNSDSTATIPYSNTTSGVTLGASSSLGKWTIGGSETFIYRDDDLASSFHDAGGNLVTKKRADRLIQSQVFAARTLSKETQLVFAIQNLSMLSNFNAGDYINRNSENASATAALRWNFGN